VAEKSMAEKSIHLPGRADLHIKGGLWLRYNATSTLIDHNAAKMAQYRKPLFLGYQTTKLKELLYVIVEIAGARFFWSLRALRICPPKRHINSSSCMKVRDSSS
jgi:hypothetical protein